MAQPDAYEPSHEFLTDEVTLRALPGSELDIEFNELARVLAQHRTNIARIQRDDGALANASVGVDQLTSELRDLIEMGAAETLDDALEVLRDRRFDVQVFGATGDGVTDDGPAIQRAVDAALASSHGGKVYFPLPEEKYLIATQIDLPLTTGKNVQFVGDGFASIIQASAGFTDPMFYVNGPSNIGGCGYSWKDLAIWGHTGADYTGVELEFGNGAIFDHVEFAFLDTGVKSANGFAIKFINGCRWRAIRTYGFYSTTACHHLTFDNIAAFNTATAGSGAFCKADVASDNIVVVHSDFEIGYRGFDLAGGTAFTFRSNYIEYFTGDPIVSSATLYGPDIADNWISLNAAWTLANLVKGQFVRNSLYDQTVTFSATTFTQMYVAHNRTWGTSSLPSNDVARFVSAGTETTQFLSSRMFALQNLTPAGSIVANQQIGAIGFLNPSGTVVAGLTAHYTNNADAAASYIDFQTGGVATQARLYTNGDFLTSGVISAKANIIIRGSLSGNLFLATSAAASGTLTLPSTTDTVVCRDTTDTLTNKTLTSPAINGGAINNATVGVATANTGRFTTVEVTSSAAVSNGINLGAANTVDVRANTALVARFVGVSGGDNYFHFSNANAGDPFFLPQGASTNIGFTFSSKGAGSLLFKTNGLGPTQFAVTHTADAVNYLNSTGGATGVAPVLSAVGSDADIDLTLTPKGSGLVKFGTRTAIGAETVTGYITIKDSGGTSRKLAVVS